MKITENVCVFEVGDFPPLLCKLTEGFTPTLKLVNLYLGARAAAVNNSTFKISIRLANDTEASEFYDWFMALNQGLFSFFITLVVFGRPMTLEVILQTDLSYTQKSFGEGELVVPLLLESLSPLPTY